VDDSPVLIRYDGSEGARNAITAAAALLAGRRAVILNVGPLALVAEAYAAAGSGAADLDRRVHADALALADDMEGNLSHEVAGHARRPVLVVPPNETPLS
jgi:hypothetical protein